jgi:hypothetical protein
MDEDRTEAVPLMHPWERDDLKRLAVLLLVLVPRDHAARGLRWLADRIEVKEVRRP